MSQPCAPMANLQAIAEISNTKITFGYASSVQQYEYPERIKKVSDISDISSIDEEQPSASSNSSPPTAVTKEEEDESQVESFD